MKRREIKDDGKTPRKNPGQQTLPGIDIERMEVRSAIQKAKRKIELTPPKINNELVPFTKRHEYPDHTIDVIGLGEKCAKEVAIEEFEKVIETGEKPKYLIIDLSKRKAAEIKYINKKAEELGIPCVEVIASPYSRAVAKEARVREDEAIMAIMRADKSIYSQEGNKAIAVIAENFGRDEKGIRQLYFINLAESMTSKSENKREEENKTFENLLRTSKDISRQILKALELKGRVIAVVGMSHTEIFDPEFSPVKEYPLESFYDRFLSWEK